MPALGERELAELGIAYPMLKVKVVPRVFVTSQNAAFLTIQGEKARNGTNSRFGIIADNGRAYGRS
jgi:hypothetical protein